MSELRLQRLHHRIRRRRSPFLACSKSGFRRSCDSCEILHVGFDFLPRLFIHKLFALYSLGYDRGMLRFTGLHERPGLLRMIPVDMGDSVIHVPVFDMQGKRSGATMLVTAGVDGDEYAGIDAAYALIDRHADGDFAGRLIIMPLVNVPGFHAECSLNPLDGKYPKLFSLGTEDGTATQRLMHRVSAYAQGASAWIDLHGGSLTEALNPFLWTYRTGVPAVDAFSYALGSAVGTLPHVHETAGMGSKALRLAKQGCAYVINESGERGSVRRADVDRHMSVVHHAMGILGMIPRHDVHVVGAPQSYSHVTYLQAPFDGIWRLHHISHDDVAHGTLIGTYAKMDGSDPRAVHAPHAGKKLWWKETMSMRKGDTLCAIAS